MQKDFSGTTEQETGDGKMIISFLNGKKQGLTKFIAKDGTVLSEIPYDNDEIHGELKQYYPDGSLMAIMTYQNGQLSGNFTTFYENGMKRMVATYERGELSGKFETFDDFGDKTTECTYLLGKKVGEFRSYYSRSQGGGIFEISTYNEKGLLTGNKIFLYQTGEVMAVTPYIDGKAQAYTKTYAKDGSEIQPESR